MAMRGAKDGHMESQVFVGNIYLTGSDTITQDFHEAIKWLNESIKQGSVVGHYLLGISYYYISNYSESLNEFLIASEKGYFPADYQIGKLYYYGTGVERNIDKAYQYFLKAKEQGHMFSSRQVAVILMSGHKGIFRIAKGVLLFFATIVSGFLLALNDPDSEKLFE